MRDFDIKRILQLVNAALSNIDFIRKNQSQYILKTKYGFVDTLNSIPFTEVAKYFSSPEPSIEKLLTEKIYRHIKKTSEQGEIDYYYQNNQFHFYNTNKPEEEWSKSQKKFVVTKTFGEDILTVDDIYEIIGSLYEGNFIFINESTFYFIPRLKDKIRGPFKIDSVDAGRRPITKYYYETNPFDKFTLFMEINSSTSKVLFIPDSNLLISNYDKLEDNFIQGLLTKTEKRKINTNSNRTITILLTVLGLCFLLIIWLFIRQGKIPKK